jgi:anhydro-N-acetylmuramic acid kinase
MIYKVIGIMSGSSLDGLDIVFAELRETAGKWNYEIRNVACMPYEPGWREKLATAVSLPAADYQLLHTAYGHYIGNLVNDFIRTNGIDHQVSIVCSHGHTTFHLPQQKMTHQLGEGAAIAAETGLPLVSDLRALDIALGGQGAPIVPLGERLLFPDYSYFLNIGGIANVSIQSDEPVAFDVCPANRVLNMLASEKELEYDESGNLAAAGSIHAELLQQLNTLAYYQQAAPKSLANSFGTDIIYPLLQSLSLAVEDLLCTYTEHICIQLKNALRPFTKGKAQNLFVTGGGAFNEFLIRRLQIHLKEINMQLFIPPAVVIAYKEALIMALLGVLRWREQYTVLASVTGASRNSIGGALWLGTPA